VVLLGTSHFERLTWFSKSISRKKPIDTFVASVGGDRVENILYRLESEDGLVAAFQHRHPIPERIVLMAGGNNLLEGYKKADTPEEVVEKMRYVIQYLQAQLPKVQLQVWAIPRDAANSEVIKKYNELLVLMCLQEKCSFSQEVYQKTLACNNGIFHDDAHLSVAGYKLCMLPFIPK
jgi:lysophospholipase L1-like esterase